MLSLVYGPTLTSIYEFETIVLTKGNFVSKVKFIYIYIYITTWMSFEGIMLSVISQRKTNTV